MKYKVLYPVRSDKKKKVWNVGDEIKDGDFPKYIIERWIQRGILEAIKDGSDD